MKKILFVITRLGAGGAPAIMLDMLHALNDAGHDVQLLTGYAPSNEKELLPALKDKSFVITVITELVRNINPLKDYIALSKIKKFIQANSFEIVHTHTTKAGLLGRMAAKSAKVPHIIHSPHGHIFEGYMNPLTTKLYIALERKLARSTTKIITLTERAIDQHLEQSIGSRRQFSYIHNGIDVAKYMNTHYHSKLKEKHNIPTDIITFCTVGRLEPIKGHAVLLDALALVKQQTTTPFNMLFVGDGQLKDDLKQKALQLNMRDCIKFIGHQENIVPFLQMSDLFILPSINEGFGLVVVEAMAAKLPVIATNVGGVPEILTDNINGKLIPPNNAQSLADAILSLMNDTKRLKVIGEANQNKALSLFTKEIMQQKVTTLYKELT
ncbi:MAG: glycosyltransferase involved in cell wall biosynthesis [Candidatus Omnitrophota bacterium]|jgi:glycosyltransferase involved in cell wall biosynthesis